MATKLPTPPAIESPFASLDSARNPIPALMQITSGGATLQQGFPPECSLPLSGGGIPPSRLDMNGMGYIATFPQYFLEQGGYYTYDPNVASAIGGYPQGAILTYYDSANKVVRKLRSLVANNSANFVTSPSVIGSAWEDVTPVIATGRKCFDVFYSLSSEAPYGALPLEGQVLNEADYPQFFARALELKEQNKIRVVTDSVYQSELAANGQVGAFVIREDLRRIRLPIINGFIQCVSSGGGIGVVHSAGMPNITGTLPEITRTSAATATGAFRYAGSSKYNDDYDSEHDHPVYSATFDASRSNPIYGGANTVQPRSVEMRLYIQVIEGDIAGASGSGGEVDYDTVRHIAEEVVSSGGHTVTALNTYSGGILVSSGGTIRGGGAIYDGLTVAGSVVQADEHIDANPLFFKAIFQNASAGISGASFAHAMNLDIPRTGESSSTLISGNLLDGGRLLISNTSLSLTGEWALPSGGSYSYANVLYGGDNYINSRIDVFCESWYKNPYGAPDNYYSHYISGAYLYSEPGHSGAWVFSGSASTEIGNIDPNGEIYPYTSEHSSGIITSDAESVLSLWVGSNPTFILYGANFGSSRGDLYCAKYPGGPLQMSGAVIFPDPEFLIYYSSSGLVEPITTDTEPWGSQSEVLSVSGGLVYTLIPTGSESHKWINSTCVSGGGICIEGAAIDSSSKTISGELQETLNMSSGGITRASGGATAMYTGWYYSSGGSVIVDRRAELGINVAGAATITVYSSGGEVKTETVATQEWVAAHGGGGGVPSGAIVSGAEFRTTVGGYTVALTSGGGLTISGGGVALQVLSGGIVASADNGNEDTPGNVVFTVSSGGIVADVFRNIGESLSGHIELTPDAIIASGASGESVVLSGGTARLANNYDYICQYIEVSQSGITIAASDPGRDINLNCYPGSVFVNSRPVLTALPTSTDMETTSANFPVLSGSTSYIYTQPLTALTFGSITSDCRAEFDFTAASGAQIGLPSGGGVKLAGSSSLDSGTHYWVAVNGARVVVVPYIIIGE